MAPLILLVFRQVQINELRSHVSNVESEKLQLDERIKLFDTDLTSNKVNFQVF